MVGYKHPCRYCNQLVPPDARVCPLCGRANPTGSFRCPECSSPVRTGWTACSHCGRALEVVCPGCGAPVFPREYCEQCDARLVVRCPGKGCGEEQPVGRTACRVCRTPLEGSGKEKGR